MDEMLIPEVPKVPRGGCPNCGNYGCVLPTEAGCQCVLCKSSWQGESYAAANKALAESEKSEREERFRDTTMLDTLADYLKTKKGRELARTWSKIIRGDLGDESEAWKGGE